MTDQVKDAVAEIAAAAAAGKRNVPMVTVSLSATERIRLSNLIPSSGKAAQVLHTYRLILDSLILTEEEREEWGIKIEQKEDEQGNITLKWKVDAKDEDTIREIPFSTFRFEKVKELFREISANEKWDMLNDGLWTKFGLTFQDD